MFPSLTPTVALYARMTTDRLAPLLFTAGYLVVWGAAGVPAFAVAPAGGPRWRHGVRARAGRRRRRRRRAGVGRRGPLGRRGDAARGSRLRAHADEGHLPGEVPQPDRVPPRRVARRAGRLRGAGGPGTP